MEPLETIDVDDHVVACDGGGSALGHPRVYLNMGSAHYTDCPYCGRRYKLRGHAVNAPAAVEPEGSAA